MENAENVWQLSVARSNRSWIGIQFELYDTWKWYSHSLVCSITRLLVVFFSTLIDHCHLSLSLLVTKYLHGAHLTRLITQENNCCDEMWVSFSAPSKLCAVRMIVCEFQVALVPSNIQIVKRGTIWSFEYEMNHSMMFQNKRNHVCLLIDWRLLFDRAKFESINTFFFLSLESFTTN